MISFLEVLVIIFTVLCCGAVIEHARNRLTPFQRFQRQTRIRKRFWDGARTP